MGSFFVVAPEPQKALLPDCLRNGGGYESFIRLMKILLLTDIPPCKNFTAGLVLDQLVRFLPPGSVACFAVVNPEVNARLSVDLNWIPVEYVKKPREKA